jgi:transposase
MRSGGHGGGSVSGRMPRSCAATRRDGFWIHRFPKSMGVESHVVDSASIEVKRRGKRRKTDRLDLGTLLRLLIRY